MSDHDKIVESFKRDVQRYVENRLGSAQVDLLELRQNIMSTKQKLDELTGYLKPLEDEVAYWEKYAEWLKDKVTS